MKKTKHGIRVIDGPLLMFAEPESSMGHRVERVIPRPVLSRGYGIAKRHHYPSDMLFRLQQGRCFFCGDVMDDFPYVPREHGGYAKAYFYPKNKHFPLWGNKVLCHAPCMVKHKNVMPTPDLVARFDHLYSDQLFNATFGEDDDMDEVAA